MKPGPMREKCLCFEPIDCSIGEKPGLCHRHVPARLTFRDTEEAAEVPMGAPLFPIVEAGIGWCGARSDFDRGNFMAAG